MNMSIERNELDEIADLPDVARPPEPAVSLADAVTAADPEPASPPESEPVVDPVAEAPKKRGRPPKAAAPQEESPNRTKTAVPGDAPVVAEVLVLKELDLLITRDPMTKVPKKAYEHELPALEFIHGVENVEVLDAVSVKLSGFDPQVEYTRLVKKYDRKNFKVIEKVYGLDGRKVAEMTGTAFGGKSLRQQRVSIAKYGAPKDDVRRA